MRKVFIAAALGVITALTGLDAPAFAQLTVSPSQTGAVGSIVSATDPNGNSRKVVEPHIICDSGCSASVPPANFTPNQVSVGTTVTLIAAARTGRQTLTVEQLGTTAVYLGGAGVTTATGAWLPGVAGSSITLNFSGALYGITASGTQTVAEYELY